MVIPVALFAQVLRSSQACLLYTSGIVAMRVVGGLEIANIAQIAKLVAVRVNDGEDSSEFADSHCCLLYTSRCV